MTGRIVLILNSGSSSLKYAAVDMAATDVRTIVAGQVDPAGGEAAFAEIDRALAAAGVSPPVAIGHRIVHGGPHLLHHCRIDPVVIRELEQAEPFAPLHVPAALALLALATARYPGLPQVACFDTTFHVDMPEIARTLPIPHALREEGVHRYGFHGLSCESILHQFDPIPERLVIAHLGNGASVTAVRGGRSIDTSMGMTPSGGVIMGTRTGDIDPGVLIHLLRGRGCTAAALEEIADRRSGMLGISGLSGDMRVLHEAARDPHVDLAIRMFCRSAAKQIAAMMATLGGADAIVFTGGIGEHDPAVRTAICADLEWTGVSRVLTLPSREEEQIARHVRTILDDT